MSSLYWGTQNKAPCSRCGLTPHFLPVLLLVEPRILLALAARAHSWLMFSLLSTETPRVLFQIATSQPSSPQPVLPSGGPPSHLQRYICALAEFSTISVGPFLQPIHIPLEGIPVLWWFCNHECTYHLSFFNENLKQDGSQERPLCYSSCESLQLEQESLTSTF